MAMFPLRPESLHSPPQDNLKSEIKGIGSAGRCIIIARSPDISGIVTGSRTAIITLLVQGLADIIRHVRQTYPMRGQPLDRHVPNPHNTAIRVVRVDSRCRVA